MACTKTKNACICTLDAEHTGRHNCACGQGWLGKQDTNADEHGALMALRETVDAEGDRLQEAMEEHDAICSLLRAVFGFSHLGAHSVMLSYKLSMEKTAEFHGMGVKAYMDGLPDHVKSLQLGAIAGAFMAEAGEVHFLDRDDDGQ